MAIDKNWQGLSASIGKLYTHESSTIMVWFVPTEITKVGGAKGWQVTLCGKVSKAVRAAIREQDLQHYTPVSMASVFAKVAERFDDVGVKTA
jgi:hypothetical protein